MVEQDVEMSILEILDNAQEEELDLQAVEVEHGNVMISDRTLELTKN